MTVEVRLFATLAQFLPPGSKHGLAHIDVGDGATVADVMTRLGIPDGLDRVVLVNGADAAAGRRLVAGDVVDVFPPLAGGGPQPASGSPRRTSASISAPTSRARLER